MDVSGRRLYRRGIDHSIFFTKGSHTDSCLCVRYRYWDTFRNVNQYREGMEMSQDVTKKLRAVMDEYYGKPIDYGFTTNRVINGYNCHQKLTSQGITAGVVAFALLNNMSGGSVGSIDLYTLLRAYLLYPDKRRRINQALLGDCEIL